MLNYPDVMKRCQAEIDDVIGHHREPSLKDKASLPFVEATLIEIQRITNVVPLGVSLSYVINNISLSTTGQIKYKRSTKCLICQLAEQSSFSIAMLSRLCYQQRIIE